MLAFFLAVLALIGGGIQLSFTSYIYINRKTPLSRNFVIFGAALFLLTSGFALRSFGDVARNLSLKGPLEEQVRDLVETLKLSALLLQALGSLVLCASLPWIVWGLAESSPPEPYRYFSLSSSALLGIFLVLRVFIPALEFADVSISLFLFLNLALGIGFLAILLGREAKKIKQGRSLENQLSFLAERKKTLQIFVGMSAFFLPLFVLDSLLGTLQVPSFIKALDNSSVPLFFLCLSPVILALLHQQVDQPAWIEEATITEFARNLFKLSDREAQVCEYVLDGYTVEDLAKVLGISPKTAENHLYGAYKKLGVNNRIQLFQTFQNRRYTSS